jgi:Ala-tRNA(Pro) deacylase
VDLCEVGYLLGVSYIRFAREDEMPDLFPDCELGAMPPFGDIFRMPVVVDAEVAKNKSIVFNIGTHQDAVRLNFEDYRALVNPLIASIIVRDAALAACK